MANFMNGLYAVVTMIKPYVYLIIAAALLINAIGFILPFEEAKNFAKKSIPWVLVGSALAYVSENLAIEISEKFVF